MGLNYEDDAASISYFDKNENLESIENLLWKSTDPFKEEEHRRDYGVNLYDLAVPGYNSLEDMSKSINIGKRSRGQGDYDTLSLSELDNKRQNKG